MIIYHRLPGHLLNGFVRISRNANMKTHTSYQTILLLTSVAFSGVLYASCVADSPEIGDIGPDGTRICTALEQDFPSATIQLENRKIQTPTEVIITALVDGQSFSIAYRLVNADWIRSAGPCLAGR